MKESMKGVDVFFGKRVLDRQGVLHHCGYQHGFTACGILYHVDHPPWVPQWSGTVTCLLCILSPEGNV